MGVKPKQPRFHVNIPSITLFSKQLYSWIDGTLLASSKFGQRRLVMKNYKLKARGKHTPTHDRASISRLQTAGHITRAVAAMDSCFTVIISREIWANRKRIMNNDKDYYPSSSTAVIFGPLEDNMHLKITDFTTFLDDTMQWMLKLEISRVCYCRMCRVRLHEVILMYTLGSLTWC